MLRALRKSDVGALELVVEIFQPHRPMRRESIFDAGARGPAKPVVNDLFVAAGGRRVDETLAGEGQPAGGVKQPVAGGVAEAAAQRSDIVQLVEHIGVGRDQSRDDRVRRQIIWKGEIGFDAEQKAGWRTPIIPALHTANYAAENAVGHSGGRHRIRQHRVGGAAAVACVSANIESGPVEHRLQIGRLDRQFHIGGARGRLENQRAKRDAREQALPVSAEITHAENDSTRPTSSLQIRRRAVIDDCAAGFGTWLDVAGSPRSKPDRRKAQLIPKPRMSQSLLQVIRNSN
jgi:hypothetical protein